MKEIMIALRKFQDSCPQIIKDSVNPYHKSKYADLDTIWTAIKDPLKECGLLVYHVCLPTDGNSVSLKTVLYHDSGQTLESVITSLVSTPQQAGSAITYARRYCISSLLGIVTEDDDDGNGANKAIKKIEERKEKKADLDMSPAPADKPLTRKQIIGQEIKKLNIPVPNIESAIGKNFNKMVFAELTTPEAEVLLKWAAEYAKVM